MKYKSIDAVEVAKIRELFKAKCTIANEYPYHKLPVWVYNHMNNFFTNLSSETQQLKTEISDIADDLCNPQVGWCKEDIINFGKKLRKLLRKQNA